MIVVAHAAAGEHAVMVALEDAGVADVAVPGARRRQAFAGSAQPPPIGRLRRAHRHDAAAGAGVAQHREREVTNDVEHDEAAEGEVNRVRQAHVPVQPRQDYPQAEPVHERRDRQDEDHRQQIADGPRPHLPPDSHHRDLRVSITLTSTCPREVLLSVLSYLSLTASVYIDLRHFETVTGVT